MPKGPSGEQGSSKIFNPLEFLKKQGKSAIDTTVGAFKDLGAAFGQTPEAKALRAYNQNNISKSTIGGDPFSLESASRLPPNQYYQVKKNDKSLADISAQTGIPVQSLATLNQTKSLPPSGSFIKLSEEAKLVNQGVPANLASQILKQTKEGFADRGDSSAQILRKKAAMIVKQFSNGQYPTNIPAAVVSFMKDNQGQQVTLQDLYADGYSMNASGVLVRAGGGTYSGGKGGVNSGAGSRPPSAEYARSQAYQQNKDTPFLQQKRWDPTTRKYESIGKLLKQGKLDNKTGRFNKYGNKEYQRKRSKVYTPPKPKGNTRNGPQTILDIHLGSG